jgi:hemolysin type calcium-binding protein
MEYNIRSTFRSRSTTASTTASPYYLLFLVHAPQLPGGNLQKFVRPLYYRLAKSSLLLAVITILAVMFSGAATMLPLSSVNAHRWHSSNVGSDQYCCILHIPDHLFTPPNQGTIQDLQNVIPGLNIPSNLIVTPSCTIQCPPIIGTQRGAVIIATSTVDASIYGVGGNNVLQCGQGSCKAVAGLGNNVLLGSTSQTTDNNRLYGGAGNNIFIGGIGSTLMVGGKVGNDQFYGGTGHDVMMGGRGANYFDCGLNGNALVLNFNPAKGDTKAPDCKFVITANSSNNYPGSTLPRT